MTFYKLFDYRTKQDVYLNPNTIVYYVYNHTYVEIYLLSREHITVDKSDFENMMILEGAIEYWNTQQSTEFQ